PEEVGRRGRDPDVLTPRPALHRQDQHLGDETEPEAEQQHVPGHGGCAVPADIRDSRKAVPATTDSPMTGKCRYRPVLAISRPDPTVDTVMPTVIGSSSRPDRVGLTPTVIWRN